MRQLVVIESPFAPTETRTVEENVDFARRACKFAVDQGYAPYASHLFFPQFLDDTDDEERSMGIRMGIHWGSKANHVWFFVPLGASFSSGMRQAAHEYGYSGKIFRLYEEQPDGSFELRSSELSHVTHIT